MNKLSEIDKNLKVDNSLKKDDIRFYDVLEAPFQIHGVFPPEKEGEPFYRLPPEIAATVNKGVAALNFCTAGGRVRFRTDSPYVAIHVEMMGSTNLLRRFSHMPLTGSAGMDLFEYVDGKERFVMPYIPRMDVKDHYESIIEFPDARPRDLTLNLPLYSGMTKLMIGVSDTAQLWPCRAYRHSLPVVYYGSSITQGGCASRPGNSYQSIISRRLDCDFINLGFSGNAKGEPEMADYIKQLSMSALVIDYDHNAPTLEHLEKTHQPFYQRIREANPSLPIIFASMPHGKGLTIKRNDETVEARYQVIKRTYDEAVKSGDTNVYLIDGREMVADIPDSWSVDLSHPNDAGFHAMAKAFGDVLEKVLQAR